MDHLDKLKSYFWPFLVILLGITTNYHAKIYAQISLVNRMLRSREKVQFLPLRLWKNFPSHCGTYAKLLSNLFHDNGFAKQEPRGLFDSASSSSSQFLQQSILISKLKPCKKSQSPSCCSKQDSEALWSNTDTSATAILKNEFYLGFQIRPMFTSKCQNTKVHLFNEILRRKIHTYN